MPTWLTVIALVLLTAGASAADPTSRMGEYSELLTVRELTDLVEFIRAIR